MGGGAPGGMNRAMALPPPCHPERSEGSGRGKGSAFSGSPTQILHFVQDDKGGFMRGDFLKSQCIGVVSCRAILRARRARMPKDPTSEFLGPASAAVADEGVRAAVPQRTF